MREFKFRICYTDQGDNKHLIYSDDRLLIGLDGTVYENYGKSWKEPLWESVFDSPEPPIIQQFTGLKDKNGKEIYEGDIVKYNYRYHYDQVGMAISKVEFINGSFRPLPKNLIEDEDDFYSYYVSNYEIIGNIFENPDLLNNP